MAVYTVETYPYGLLLESDPVHRKKGQRKKNNERTVFDVCCAFDIETTTIHFTDDPENDHDDHAIMYIWQFAIESDVIYGRDWESFKEHMYNMADVCAKYKELNNLSELPYFIIWVHNLAYEFQYLSDPSIYPFKQEECFFRAPRKPIFVRMHDCCEFRCSYVLTQMSLKKFCKEMNVKDKLSGQEYDYSKLRYPWTDLSDRELDYCFTDVLSLTAAIREKLNRDNDNLKTIPLTATGYVRRDCKAAIYPLKKRIDAMKPGINEYRLLRKAFRGGNTHCNRAYAGKILENVNSYDMVSCYPAQQLTKDFPISAFVFLGEPYNLERVQRYIGAGYAVVATYQFKNLRLKNKLEPIPYLSISKCDCLVLDRFLKDGELKTLCDNGRVLQTAYAQTTLTEIDLHVVLEQYTFDECNVLVAMSARKGRLPPSYKEVIKNYYDKKTILKGCTSPEDLYTYARSKASLNSIYGMSAQDPIHQKILYVDGEYIISDYDSEKAEESLEHAPFPYQWGVYTTAYARYALQRAINAAGDKMVYCDTDSVKVLGDIDINRINKPVDKAARSRGAVAKDRNGTDHVIGVYELDAHYDKFISWGAKRYAFDKNGDIGITVSGVSQEVNEKSGKRFCVEEMGSLENFKPGMIWSKAGPLMAVYNDTDNRILTVDGHTIAFTKNVALVKSTYQLELEPDYKALMLGLELYKEYMKRHE